MTDETEPEDNLTLWRTLSPAQRITLVRVAGAQWRNNAHRMAAATKSQQAGKHWVEFLEGGRATEGRLRYSAERADVRTVKRLADHGLCGSNYTEAMFTASGGTLVEWVLEFAAVPWLIDREWDEAGKPGWAKDLVRLRLTKRQNEYCSKAGIPGRVQDPHMTSALRDARRSLEAAKFEEMSQAAAIVEHDRATAEREEAGKQRREERERAAMAHVERARGWSGRSIIGMVVSTRSAAYSELEELIDAYAELVDVHAAPTVSHLDPAQPVAEET